MGVETQRDLTSPHGFTCNSTDVGAGHVLCLVLVTMLPSGTVVAKTKIIDMVQLILCLVLEPETKPSEGVVVGVLRIQGNNTLALSSPNTRLPRGQQT